MVSQSEVAISALRRRRSHLRRVIRAQIALGHGIDEMRPVLARYLRVGGYIRRSLQRSERVSAVAFNLNAFSQQEALNNFRFFVPDLGRLSSLLDLQVDVSRRRYNVSPIECLAIVLRRLASPSRWTDLELLFGRSASSLSEIFCRGVDELIGRWGHLITTWRAALMAERAAAYAAAIAGKDAPLQTCVGFIDGTLIRIARPGRGLQRVCYSGHKRCHAIKFQSICTPDGLLFHLFGPVEGRRHDMLLYHESGVDAQLEATLLIDETQFSIYGDSAYILRAWIQRGYGAWSDGDAEEQAYDGAMNRLREAVEGGLKEVKQQFTSLDFKRKLKICETSVGAQYLSGALLRNMRSCFYGNQTSTYFDCAAPSIERYLQCQ